MPMLVGNSYFFFFFGFSPLRSRTSVFMRDVLAAALRQHLAGVEIIAAHRALGRFVELLATIRRANSRTTAPPA